MGENKLQNFKRVRPMDEITRSFRIFYVAGMIAFLPPEKPESQTLALRANGYGHIN